MKRQVDSNPYSGAGDGDDAVDPSLAASERPSPSRSRKRRSSLLQNPQLQSERSMAPSSSIIEMPTFSNDAGAGLLSAMGGAFPTLQPTANALFQNPSSMGTFFVLPPGAQTAAAANVQGSVGVPSFNPIYAGNIAAACEATNQEVAQKQKEVIKDDNEELQRKKAASRITAWQSRERKRIEMEVLQERKAELTRRNADLRSENEQLRLLISNLKPIVQNPDAPRQLVPSQQFSENSLRQAESGMSGMAAPIRGMVGVASSSSTDQPHKSTQPPIYTHPFAFADNQSLYGFPSATATANAAQSQSFTNFFQQSQGQQQTFSHQIPPFGLSLADLASLQQRVQMQQRPESQDNSFSAGGFSFHGTSTPTPLNLINDTVSPLARQQSTISAQQSTAMNSNRYPIPPHPSQPEDTRGAPPLDITSLLLPQGNFRVDIPLIRAVPKRKESENIEDKSQEKTKDDV